MAPRAQSMVMGMSWPVGLEAADHTVSVVRMRGKMNAGAHLASFYAVWGHAAHGMVLPTFRVGLSTPIHLI